jgi:hypothetical protein
VDVQDGFSHAVEELNFKTLTFGIVAENSLLSP